MIETLQAAFLGAIEAQHPTKHVKAWIRAGNLDDFLQDPESPETIHVFAVGKAAASMAWGLAETNVPLVGHGVLPHGLAAPTIPGMKWRYATHPVPQEDSFAAGKHWLELAASIPEHAPVLLLLSGGASSLLEWPPLQFAPDGDILELNAKRAEHSQLKGGKWMRLLQERTHRVKALILPDVPPGSEEWVGAGLAMRAELHILPGNAEFLSEFAGLMEAFGVPTEIYPDRLQGPIEAQMESFLQQAQPGTLRLGGGEVEVHPTHNKGGRCQHAALLAGTIGAELFVALATDGVDGNHHAGAWSGPDGSPDAAKAVAEFAATQYLESKGQTITTGPTGTNVNDLWALWTAK